MKQLFTVLFIFIVVLGFSFQTHAALEFRGQGTSAEGTYRLIYDTDLNITWYDYTRSGDYWQTQMNWADGLSVTFGSNTYTDWRLPTVTDIGNNGCNWGYSSTDCGYNVDTSTGEMAHLWYDELGNLAEYDTSGNLQSGWGLTKTGDFQNLQAYYYWSATEYPPDPMHTNFAWHFNTDRGLQSSASKINDLYAIAVRSGDVAVIPEPISSILFLTGGATLIGRKYIRRKKIEV